MTLRSMRERVLQTLLFEAGGLIIATMLYAALFDRALALSALLIVSLSAAMLIWMPLHNTLFDWMEWRLANRRASDRPHGLRLAQAVSFEVSSTLVTLPIVMHLGGHGFIEALGIDLGLSVLYIAYGYLFHLAYDHLRPVQANRAEGGL